MSYFGGTVSQRPWSGLDFRFIFLFILSVAGIVAGIWMLRESMMAQLAQQQAGNVNESKLAAVQQVSAQPVVALSQQPPSLDVLVATDNIASGTRLRPSMFRLEARNTDNGLADRALLDLNKIEGSYARVSMSAGSTLFKDSIESPEAALDITERIPLGYRAVAIPVNIVTGVEGWIRPGARVDVIWSTENRGKLIATTLIENAQILSAERTLESQNAQLEDRKKTDAPVPSHVTLLVSTSDSHKLQLAKNSGSLSLSLRGNLDEGLGNSATISTDSIIKNRKQALGDSQGRVSFGGEDYILNGSKLIPEKDYQAQMRAQMKKSADF